MPERKLPRNCSLMSFFAVVGIFGCRDIRICQNENVDQLKNLCYSLVKLPSAAMVNDDAAAEIGLGAFKIAAAQDERGILG